MAMGSFLGNGLGLLLSRGGGSTTGCLATSASILRLRDRASSDLRVCACVCVCVQKTIKLSPCSIKIIHLGIPEVFIGAVINVAIKPPSSLNSSLHFSSHS